MEDTDNVSYKSKWSEYPKVDCWDLKQLLSYSLAASKTSCELNK